jgi:hypothetical protein
MITKTTMRIPFTQHIAVPELKPSMAGLALAGKLKKSANNLVYLDIDDEYIHRLYPLIKNDIIKKPDYFKRGSAGAHITVIYPEENKNITSQDLGQEHIFVIKDFVSARLDLKTYYILLVESPSLLKLRQRYHLPDLLSFKGYSIGFHITVGVQINSES